MSMDEEKMFEELVSILMCVYIEPIEYVENAVESIVKQTYRNLEIIIIIDNANRKDVVQYLEELNDIRVHYYINEKNLGLATSLNIGLRVCHGKYIARMDADDIAVPERIEQQYIYIKKNRVDILGGSAYVIDEKGIKIGQIKPPILDKFIQEYIMCGGALPHPTWFAKKSVFQRLEGYREITSIEDYDFLIRGILHGYKFGCLQNTVIYYRRNLKGISQNNKGRQAVLSKLLRLQYREKRIYTLNELTELISEKECEINKMVYYYNAMRKMRNLLIDGKYVKISLKELFFIFLSRQLYIDFFNDVKRKQICWKDKMTQKRI